MFAIHDCYLDDSKDKRQEFAYVCAGFFATEEIWRIFTKAWRKQLKSDGIEYFKSSECNSLNGQFEKFKDLPLGRQSADLIKQRLQKIALGFRGIHGVGVALPVEEHEAVSRHENATRVFPKEHMYYRVFEATVLEATTGACVNPKDLMVFVHDDESDFGNLLAIFKDFKVKNPKSGKRLTAFLPMDDKTTPALQLADMFANSIQGLTVEFLNGREEAPSNEIFMFDRSGVKVWTRELGEKVLVANFKSRSIPVPQSLEDAIAAHGQLPRRYPRKRST